MKFCLSILLLFLLSTGFAQTVNDLRPTVTMKEYVDMQVELSRQLAESRAEANRRTAEVQFDNISDNVTKANAANEKRFDGVNEFRSQLKDQASTFVTWTALGGLIIGISGFLFGYANYKRNQVKSEPSNGKSIMSGDKVEVKK